MKKDEIKRNLGTGGSLTEEEVKQAEKDLGSFPDSLLGLAKLVRDLDKNANSPVRDHETIKKQLWKVYLATKRLRPKIELVIGIDQTDEFQHEIYRKLRFWRSDPSGDRYDDGSVTSGAWLGQNGEAEGIARRLEQWNRNILLLTRPEISTTESNLKPQVSAGEIESKVDEIIYLEEDELDLLNWFNDQLRC